MAAHPAKRVEGGRTEISIDVSTALSTSLAHLSLAPPLLSSRSMLRRRSLPGFEETSTPVSVVHRHLTSPVVECDGPLATRRPRRMSLKDTPRFSKDAKKEERQCFARTSSGPPAYGGLSSMTSQTSRPIACRSENAYPGTPGAPSKMLLAFESVEDWGRCSSSDLERYGAGFNAH
jgi:hypothetical protein